MLLTGQTMLGMEEMNRMIKKANSALAAMTFVNRKYSSRR